MPNFVTKKDYFDFSGIDLDIELKKSNTDNPSKAVDIFLKRVEDWCLEYLRFNYFVTDIDFDYFKKGVLHQIDYIRKNGDLSIHATENLKVLAPNAFRSFKMGGMCNTTLPRTYNRNPWV